jgi:hypothetical protein
MTEHWFRPKRYGYGAVPITWQGWALTLCSVAVMVAVSVYLRHTARHELGLAAMFVFDALALAFLFIVCRHKTEGGLHWRWGDR